MNHQELDRWIARAQPGELLPQRHAAEAASIPTPFLLLDALTLAPGAVVALVEDAAGRAYPVPLAAREGGWRRARAGDGLAAALTSLVTGDAVAALTRSRFELTRWATDVTADAALTERAIEVDQTNESLIVAEQVVVKWTVRSSGGPEPAPARLEALVAAGFTDMPRPWGVLRWRPNTDDPAADPLLIATLMAYLPGAVDGWVWAVDDVRELARGRLTMAESLTPAAAMGAVTARMHLSLPERGTADTADTQRWADGAREELAEAVAVVDGPEGERLQASAGRMHQLIDRLSGAGGTTLIDTHGDLHVGQMLRWRRSPSPAADYAVTDFDGNPVLPPQERLAAAPPAVDLAGLVQSLDHVGRVVVHRTEHVDESLVHTWITAAQSALLTAYRRTIAAAGRSDLLDESLLPAFRARQVIREYLYAARHLPHWRYVPHAALPALLQQCPMLNSEEAGR